MSVLGGRNLIGLDVGNSSIKAVHLKASGGRLSLINLAMAEIPSEIQDESDPEVKLDLMSDLIRQMLKEHRIQARDVASALAGDDAIVRYVKLPHMSDEELKNVIAYEAEQYIPLSMEQVTLDYQTLGVLDEEGQKKLEVLLVAAKTEIVDRHVSLLNRAGLNPVAIDVDTFALCNAYEHNYGKAEDETVSLLNIGAKLTSITILENGVPHLTRDIPVAGNNFTQEIQRELDVPAPEAETLKREQGQVVIETEDIIQIDTSEKQGKSGRIGEAITPVLNKLLAEIRRSFDYYESSIRKKPVSKIILSGGTARLKNLDKYLADKLNVPVELNDPFKAIHITEKQFDMEFILGNAQRFNIGLGLALRLAE